MSGKLYMLRYRSEEPIEPIEMYSYRLDLSRADRETDPVHFLNIMTRYLKTRDRKYFPVHDKNDTIYTLKPVDRKFMEKECVFNNRKSELRLSECQNEKVPMEKKEIYEQLLKLLIQRNLYERKYNKVQLYTQFNDKISTIFHPIIGTRTYEKHERNSYYDRRVYDIRIEIDNEHFFTVIFNNIKTIFLSKHTVLDLFRMGRKIDKMEARYQMMENITNYSVSGVVHTDLPKGEDFDERWHTVSGLRDYFKTNYSFFSKFSWKKDDFVVILQQNKGKNKGKTGSYLASMLEPILDFNTISSIDPTAFHEIQRWYLLNMNTRFMESHAVVENIGEIPEFNNARIHKNKGTFMPCSPRKFGFESGNINPPTLLIKNKKGIDKQIRSDEKKIIFFPDNQPYRLPRIMREKGDIKIAVASMTSNPVNETELMKCVEQILLQGIYNFQDKNKILLKYFCYDRNKEPIAKEFSKMISESMSPHIVVGVVDDERKQFDFEEDECNVLYPEMKEAFAFNNIPSQMFTLETLRKYQMGSNIYISHNLCMGILGKLDGTAFALEENPCDVDLYIGLDVGMVEAGLHVPCCASAFMGAGQFIGVFAPIEYTTGEIIKNDILKNIFDNFMMFYNNIRKVYPKRIVIHRDGTFQEDIEWVDRYFNRFGTRYQIVEVIKSGAERFLDNSRQSEGLNPAPGTVIYDNKKNESLLVTTEPRIHGGGAPRPLKIRLLGGNLGLGLADVTKQVYWLTKISDSSLHNTRLPVTVRYADLISKHPTFIPHGKVVGQKYFI